MDYILRLYHKNRLFFILIVKKRLENTNALYVLFALPWITRPLYPFDIGGTWQIKILSYLVGAYNLKKEKTRLVICYVYNVYMY